MLLLSHVRSMRTLFRSLDCRRQTGFAPTLRSSGLHSVWLAELHLHLWIAYTIMYGTHH
jgi:hypothetical protein